MCDFIFLLFQKPVKKRLEQAVTVSEGSTEEDTFQDSVDLDQGWLVVEINGMMVLHIDY